MVITAKYQPYNVKYVTTTASSSKKKYNFSGYIPNKDLYIKSVIYNNPAIIVFWNDGTKTVCKCHEADIYNEETGLVMCMLKKILGTSNFKRTLEDWTPENMSMFSQVVTLSDVMKNYK